jgi:hypothetical protein
MHATAYPAVTGSSLVWVPWLVPLWSRAGRQEGDVPGTNPTLRLYRFFMEVHCSLEAYIFRVISRVCTVARAKANGRGSEHTACSYEGS